MKGLCSKGCYVLGLLETHVLWCLGEKNPEYHAEARRAQEEVYTSLYEDSELIFDEPKDKGDPRGLLKLKMQGTSRDNFWNRPQKPLLF